MYILKVARRRKTCAQESTASPVGGPAALMLACRMISASTFTAGGVALRTRHGSAKAHPKDENTYVLRLVRHSVCAIYQIIWGWKTYKYYYETDEFPNPRPTQPTKKMVESGIWATFSHGKYFVRGLGLVLYRKQTTRNPTQPNYSQTP